jgi:hypothetical protein
MGFLTAMREDAYPATVNTVDAGGAFNLAVAGTMAWAAQLAYEVNEPAKTARILGRWGWSQDRTFGGQFASHLPLVSTKGFTAMAGDDLVIAFAGTEPTNLLNWIENFSIHETADGVTDGFLAGFEAVHIELEARVAETRGGIWLSGHSLGGAICAIAARNLIAQGKLSIDRILGVYTFGMPRPGNASYAATYDAEGGSAALGQRTFRFVYGRDIVPMLPPSNAPFDFRHVGLVMDCPSGGMFTGMPRPQDPPSDLGLINELERDFRNEPGATVNQPDYPAAYPLVARFLQTLPQPVRDHLPDRYLSALGVPASIRN